MREQVYEQLTFFREDFPASHFPWLESKKVKGTTVICGRKCSELSENLRRVGSWVRTYLESCELPLPTLYRTWSVKDMTSRCLILKLRLSERRTAESESRLLPTVTSADINNSTNSTYARGNPNLPKAAMMWPTPKASDSVMGMTARTSGRPIEKSTHLQTRVYCAEHGMFPTPRAQSSTGQSHAPNRQGSPDLQTFVKMWPTVTTGAGLCGGTGNFQRLQELKDAGVISEEERRSLSQGNGGQLNPPWVEWLMGFPIGWTELGASETP